MGSPTFEQAIASTNEIHGQFERHFPNGQLEDWAGTTHKDYSAFDISNWYLTPKIDAPAAEHITFNKLIDPFAILEGMAKSDYIHTEENEVYYYNCLSDDDGTKR
jgi:hypothetical protein